MSFTWVAFWQICTWGVEEESSQHENFHRQWHRTTNHPEGKRPREFLRRRYWWRSLCVWMMGSSGLRSFTINPKVCVIYDLTDFGVLFCGICKAGRLCITQNVWIWTIFFSKLMCKNLSLALAGFWANGASLLWRNKQHRTNIRGK